MIFLNDAEAAEALRRAFNFHNEYGDLDEPGAVIELASEGVRLCKPEAELEHGERMTVAAVMASRAGEFSKWPPQVKPVPFERQEHFFGGPDDIEGWYLVVYDPGDWWQSPTGIPGWLGFVICEQVGTTVGGERPVWFTWDDNVGQTAEVVEDAYPVAWGTVKWDGALDFITNRMYIRMDESVVGFGAALAKAYEICKEAIVEDDV